MNIAKQMTRDPDGKCFDAWTIAHTLFGIIIALIVKNPVLGITIVIALAILHEFTEPLYWPNFKESIDNSVMDIIVAVVGASVIYMIKYYWVS